MAQGRSDFLFGIDQGDPRLPAPQGSEDAVRRAPRSRAVDVPRGGHRLPDEPSVRAGSGASCANAGCGVSSGRRLSRSEKLRRAAVAASGTPPPVSPTFVSFPGVTTFARSGKAARTSAPLRQAIEVYGTPTVQTSIAASGGWSRLVAVLSARTPAGKEIVVSAGGVPTKPGAQKVTIQLVEPGDAHPEGLAAHAHACVLVHRPVELEPPVPRSAHGADRSRTRRHRGPQAARPAHAGHEVTARAAAVALAALALVATAGAAPVGGSRRHPDERPPRRNRPAHGRGRGVRNASAQAPGPTSTTSTRRAA